MNIVALGAILYGTEKGGWGMQMKTTLWLGLCLAAGVALGVRPAPAGDVPVPLRDVHRIIFLGDSITHNGHYVADVECWLLTRGLDLEVLNLGLSSESGTDLTAAENLGHKTSFGFARPCLSERLDRVLAATKPDLVIACYGMNDGGALPPDETGTQRFAAAMTRLREAALKSGAKRVVLFDAWMTKIGHTRPGVPGFPGVNPGPSLQVADERAAEFKQQIADKRRKVDSK